MSDDGTKLAPAPTRPAPSPAIAEPVSTPRTTPKPKQKRIPRMVVAATDVLLNGKAKNLTQAAEQIGCSREYLSRTLSARPDAVQYMKDRAARVLGIASTVAAARMAELIHAGSEHVAFRASEHVLGVAGIAPAHQPQVNVNIDVKAGYVIDLSEPGQPQKIVSGAVIDEKLIDAPAD